MSDFVQDFFTSRSNYADGNTRIGQLDRLWYDSITNTVRISDGITPGGIIVSGGGTGISGYSGAPGISGYSGASFVGSSGYSGATGSSGYSGLAGYSGFSGYSGAAGVAGASGYSGVGVSGYSGATGEQGISGYSGQSFSGDYVSSIIAGTGVSVSGASGSGSTPTISIGQPVAITDSVEFGNVLIGALGEIQFTDDIALAALHGANFPYKQISAAGRFYTNADAIAGYSTTDMKPGDWYYDDVGQTIYLCIDTGLGYFDFLDLTQRA